MRRMTEARNERHTIHERRSGRAARWGAEATVGRPGGREGEERMEIKIIINEAGTGRGMRRFDGEGRRSRHVRAEAGGRHEGHRRHRHGSWGADRREERSEGRMHSERESERGRVVGKVIELPDGTIRVVRKGEPGAGPGFACGMRRPRPEAGHADDPQREARRARRRMARAIARALDEAGYNKA